MTAVLGVLCRDGVVLGSDGASSAVRRSGAIQYERAKRKVWVVANSAMGASAGNAAVGQRIKIAAKRFFDATADNLNFPQSDISDSYEIADRLRQGVLCELDKVDMAPAASDSALIAFPVGDDYAMVKFSGSKLRPKLIEEDLHYETVGSGSAVVNPFFEFLTEIFWNDSLPTMDEATIGVVWALEHAIATSSAGVNTPITVGAMKQNEAPVLLQPAITQEAKEFIVSMKTVLKDSMKTRFQDAKPMF